LYGPKTDYKKVPWAFPRHSSTDIKNKEKERKTTIVGGVRMGETLPESPLVGSTPSGMFIFTIYNNTILIPLL
jgi:hypothetical protein